MPCKRTISVNVISSKVGCHVSTNEGLGCLEKLLNTQVLGREETEVTFMANHFLNAHVKVSVYDSSSHPVTPSFLRRWLANCIY